MIPGTGLYYWLPVLPKFTEPEELCTFPTVVPPNMFASESEVRQFLNEHYPVGYIRGQGFWAKFGDSVFLSHSYENTDIAQTIRLELKDWPIARIKITWGPNAYAIIHRARNAATIDHQGRITRGFATVEPSTRDELHANWHPFVSVCRPPE